MARLALAALTASAALLVGATTASAATVDNPGPFTATFDSGELSVLDGAALVPLPAPVTVSGSIDGDGAIASPASGGRARSEHAARSRQEPAAPGREALAGDQTVRRARGEPAPAAATAAAAADDARAGSGRRSTARAGMRRAEAASSPATGKKLAAGAKVALTISDGPAKKKKRRKK